MAKQTRVSTKQKDYLDQDASIRGQNYVCLSFISPEDAIASKDAFTVKRFLQAFTAEAKKVFSDAEERIVNEDDKVVIKNLIDRYKYVFDDECLLAEYDAYRNNYSKQLDDDYAKLNDHQCSIRGIKIRGAYETLSEAQSRAEQLKRIDSKFHVYVAEMGCWCPWSPNPEDIKDAEYSETELNTLMKKYKENMAMKDELYEFRKKELMAATEAETGEVEEIVGSSSGGTGVLIDESSKPIDMSDIADMINAPVPATTSSPGI